MNVSDLDGTIIVWRKYTMNRMLKHSFILALCLSLLFCAVCRAEIS